MPSKPQVALLRGVNVGGHNVLPMGELRAALEASGMSDVRTYIQSGNIVFRSDDPEPALAIAAVLHDSFGIDVPVLVRSLEEVERVAAAHPDVGSDIPPKWLHAFLLDRPADAAAAPDPDRFEPDRLVVDGREIYATYPNGSGRSKLTLDVIERSFEAVATARNLSTLAAIVALGRQS